MKTNKPREQLLRGNLRRLSVFEAVYGSSFMCAVLVPFFLDEGLSLSEVFWLQGLFGLFVAVLEVPSGYFADRCGRKRSLIAGGVAVTAGLTCYTFGSGFLQFLFCEFLLAVGCCLLSGANTALLYDTLAELDEVERYPDVLARQRSIQHLAAAVTAALGGLVAIYGFRWTFGLDALATAVMVLAAVGFVEPVRQQLPSSVGVFDGLKDIVRGALVTRRETRLLIILSAGLCVSTLCAFWFQQPVLLETGFPIPALGLVIAVLRLSGAASSLAAPAILRALGFTGTVLTMISLFGVTAIAVALVREVWVGALFIGFGVVRSISLVAFSEAINDCVSSDRRATVLSLESLIMRLWFLPVAAVAGGLADWAGLSVAILVVSGVLVAITTWLTQRLEKVRRARLAVPVPAKAANAERVAV